MNRRPASVLVNEPLTPNVRRIHLAIDDGPFVHVPGQALVVEVAHAGTGGGPVRAPYSIASAPGEYGPAVVEIAVAKDAPGSRALTMHELPVGAKVEIVGPIGSFVRSAEAEHAPALFVAAGTGLSPLRSMLAAELGRNFEDGPRLVLLFGTRSEEDVLWADDLRAWPQRSPRVTTIVTLSRAPDLARWQGRRGWVQAHLAEAVALAGPDAHAFVCGPDAMVQGVMRLLADEHLPEVRVHRERYS